MEAKKKEELSDDELAMPLRFWALRVYGGKRELMEQAEWRIRAKAEKNEASKDGSDVDIGCGCLVWIVILLVLLKIIGCV